MLKAKHNLSSGDLIRPLPSTLHVYKDQLVVPDGDVLQHSEDFNATIVSHFLVAVRPIVADEAIQVNLNLVFYDMIKDTERSDDFREPVVPGFRFLSEEEKQNLYVYADEDVRQRAISDGFVPQQKESGINVLRKKKDTLVAVCAKECVSGDVVFQTTGVLLPFPVRSTIELPDSQHLRLTGGSEFIRHSCLPNLRLEVKGKEIRGIALRPMETGELLTFNYLCTEWEISKVFQCSCNKYCCYGLIKGFKYLDREQREHLLPNCTEVIREKYQAPLASAATLNAVQKSNALSLTTEGRIVAQKYVPAGTVLLTVSEAFKIEGSDLVLQHTRLPHSCDASTALVEGRLVSARPLLGGDVLTFNLNTVCYQGSGAACRCGQGSCMHAVCGFQGLSREQQNRLWAVASDAVREEAIRHHYEMSSTNPLAVVKRTDTMGEATFARKNIVAGARIFHVTGLVLPFPTVYTIFIGESKHLLFSDEARCLAHSCQPNTRIVVDAANGSLDCFATCDIEEGALLSFNYLTTEWDMKEPFQCACGSPQCYGKIRGFVHLRHEEQLRLWSLATKAIQARYATTAATSSVLATLNRDLVAPCGTDGELLVCQELPSGTVLFEAASFVVEGQHVVLGDVRVPHSCSPSAAYLNGRVVLKQSVTLHERVTLNVNELVYRLPESFSCRCGQDGCVGHVGGFAQLTEAQQDAIILCTMPSVREEAVAAGYRNKSACPLVEVRANGQMGQATFAARDIKAGTRFFKVNGLVLPFPTVYTIMLAPNRHLLFAGGAQCLAHSCDPNVRVMVDRESNTLDCLALRPIHSGELISFNYLCTEWDMDSPFKCVCGSPECYGKISGFKHLTDAQRQKLWSTTSPVIRSFFKQEGNWSHLCSSQLRTDASGHVRAAVQLLEGTPVLSSIRRELHAGFLVVDGIQLRHSCVPTAAVVENSIVLLGLVCEGTEITVDMNCLAYALEQPFTCHCFAHAEPHMVRGFGSLPQDVQATRLIFTDAAVRSEALANGYQVPCSSPLVRVKANGDMGQATFAAAAIQAGSRLLTVKGVCLPFPTVYTIMLTENRHLLFAEGAQCLAHSCNPNVRISIDAINNVLECEALRDIEEGELIAFDYNTTEWSMSAPFHCLCGAPSCVFEIRGYKHLTRAQRERIQPLTTPAIKQLAGAYSDVHLPPSVSAGQDGFLTAATAIPKESVVLDVFYMDIEPHQIGLGREYAIPHSNAYNCVLVEGRIVSCVDLAPGTLLTVNMNFFVYDMKHLFPRSYQADCQGFRYMDEAMKQKYLYLCEPPVRAQAMRDGWTVRSTQEALVVRPNGEMGQTAYATRDIAVGTTLFHCTGLIVPFPTMYTICTGVNKHLLFGDAAECIAHHCDPNVEVVVNDDYTFDFRTIKPIQKGEMVTFNYATTEWDMNSPFLCLCGAPTCAGVMKGFKHLSDADRQRLWSITSPVVKAKCDSETK